MLRVSKVILCHDSRVLLVQRFGHSIRESLKWQLPGGGIEAGETPLEAARREIREETGLSINFLEQIAVVPNFAVIFYGEIPVETCGQIKLGNEGVGLGLFSALELPYIETTEATKAALPRLLHLLTIRTQSPSARSV